MGHVGLTPQSVRRLGGFKVQRDAAKLMDDALAVEAAGAFSLVIECVPTDVAARITEAVKIPTIGIGAGPHCDGQVLVTPDLLGLFDELRPRFVKQYADLGREVTRGGRGVLPRGARGGVSGGGTRVPLSAPLTAAATKAAFGHPANRWIP